MKLCTVMLAFGMSALVAARAAAQAPTTAPAPAHEVDPAIIAFMKPVEVAPGDDELLQKLKERHNTAVRLLELRVDAYRKGVGDGQSVFDAVRLVSQSKLELAQNDTERQAALQQILDMSKTIESRLQKQLESGFGSESDLQRAKLARETAEIELLKLKRAPTTQRQ
jgi:outer membrane protein TolC